MLKQEALDRAEVVYKRITGYVNYEEMNGISKSWFIEKIAEGIQDAHPEKFYLSNPQDEHSR